MIRTHVVIAGTGRAGTTLIVQILTELGLDTGFEKGVEVDSKIKAGLESDIRKDDAPYIIKSPWFYLRARHIYSLPDITIDHMFVPIRELYNAAESRRVLQKGGMRRGLIRTGSLEEGDQEKELAFIFYKLMRDVSDTNIPVTMIRYPKLAKDSEYLYKKLNPVLKNITYGEFKSAFYKVLKPEWVKSK